MSYLLPDEGVLDATCLTPFAQDEVFAWTVWGGHAA